LGVPPQPAECSPVPLGRTTQHLGEFGTYHETKVNDVCFHVTLFGELPGS